MASAEDVQKLASLARVSIPEEKLEKFAKDFDGILAYVGKLEELTLPNVGTMTVSKVRNAYREDGEPHEKGKYTEALVAQFPESNKNYLSVKQIISHD